MKNKIILVVVFVLFFLFFSKTYGAEVRVCPHDFRIGFMSCNAHMVVDNDHNHQITTSIPHGLNPQQLRVAYTISGRTKNLTIIAIIDAYDNPTILQDLTIYSNKFGLPKLLACKNSIGISAIPCFEKISQGGTKKYPHVDKNWALEISLDVEAAHAMCENCSILLVEAASPTLKNFGQALDTARSLGATIISNSYGGAEFLGETIFDTHFNYPGIAFITSSGDSGYGAQYPAASPYVTAVGGTTLYLKKDGTYKNEDAWAGAGSGCSEFEKKPTWQIDKLCSHRTIADVSAVADPATGMAIYSATGPKNGSGWFTAGGTSLSAPLIAGIYAVSGAIQKNSLPNSFPYTLGNNSNLHDVVGGSNGNCEIIYLCFSKTHYDGPTGLGSPKGTGAF